jgi:hypothetical protein
MFTIICLFGHDIAQLLLTVMIDVGSCPNQFCLMFSTRLCVVNHNLTLESGEIS